jgi:lysophospholipase
MHIAAVPSTNTFVNKGLNTRPVFFGCNATDTPLIIYIPHYPWTAYSNSSTFQLAYEMDEATDQMLSSMRSLTLNGTVPTWPKCLACALTDRANGFTSENRSAECAECFDTWCWDGESDDSDPAEDYAPLAGVTPQFLIDKNLSSDVRTTSFDPKATTKDSAAQRSALSASALVAILAGSVIALL